MTHRYIIQAPQRHACHAHKASHESTASFRQLLGLCVCEQVAAQEQERVAEARLLLEAERQKVRVFHAGRPGKQESEW